jgi:hypothetical protein
MQTFRQMLRWSAAASLVAVAACASAGRFPADLGDTRSDAQAAIGEAERQIAAAANAGGDSLAVDAMTGARAHLAAARESEGKSDRLAVLRARQAAADAVYARALAERVLAERARARARAAVDALGPGGAR